MRARYREKAIPATRAVLGFAADDEGCGVAYARLGASGEQLLRVPFRVRRYPGLGGREVGYAALAAVAGRLSDRGVSRVAFEMNDAELVSDVAERRSLPAPLILPYVGLRCSLNRLDAYALTCGPGSEELAQRARAEVSVHVAA
ncbi:MAG: hypothetical protein ACLQPV_04375 [Vulcanimicrobiaceae bacterium]